MADDDSRHGEPTDASARIADSTDMPMPMPPLPPQRITGEQLQAARRVLETHLSRSQAGPATSA